MAKKPYNKVESIFGKSEGGGSHKASPIPGQMKSGKASCVADRAGSFKGTPSDLRNEQGNARFGRAAYRQAGPVDGGGAGHTKQTMGHSSLSRGNFAKKPGRMNPQG